MTSAARSTSATWSRCCTTDGSSRWVPPKSSVIRRNRIRGISSLPGSDGHRIGRVHSFWTPLRVRLVVAAAAIAFAFGLYFIGANIGGDKTYSVYAMFDDARARQPIAGADSRDLESAERQ